MSVILHVRGEVQYGKWRQFCDAFERYREYRRGRNHVVPQLLVGISGPMNSTILVYRYESAKAFEEEDRAIAEDPQHGKVASEMPFREGSIVYQLFREA